MPKDEKSTIKTFSVASFLNDMGSDMIYPIWPLFVTTVIEANMAVLGFLDGLGIAIVSLSQALSGYISDRTKKRKIFIWLGYLLGSISRIGYALSTTWHMLIPFKMLDRFGKIRGAPRDAMVADISSDKTRARNFGILRAMDHAGAALGVIVTIILMSYLDIRTIFYLAAIPSLLSVILIVAFIKEKTPAESKLYKGMTLKNLTEPFKRYTAASVLFALGAFSYSFVLIYAKEYGFALTTVPVLYLAYTIIASLTSIPFSRIADKIGRKRTTALSYLLWAGVTAVLLLSPTKESIIIAIILYGLHLGALETVQKTYVSELAEKEYRASTLGTFQMLIGLAALPASTVAGLLWLNVGLEAPLKLSLILTIAATAILMTVREPKRS